MASTSRPACALVWLSTLEPPQLDTVLASLDDAMAHDYFQLRIRAATTALTNPGANPTPADPVHVREAVAQVLGAEAWSQTAALLEKPDLSVDEACYLEEAVFGGLASMAPQTRVDLVRELFAATAAAPSALPPACLGL